MKVLTTIAVLVAGFSFFVVSAGAQEEGFVLTVKVKGQGHVTSDDEQIDCPSPPLSEAPFGCEGFYFESETVTLTEHPDPGWKFDGWSGDCSGHDEHCTLVMDEDHKVTATFVEEPPQHPPGRPPSEPTTPPQSFGLSAAVVGDGSVASSPGGISCGGDCSETYPEHTHVSLVPIPGAGSTFVGWSGDCSGSGGCSVTMDGPRSVTATFTKQQPAPPETVPPQGPVVENVIVGDNLRLSTGFTCYAPEELFLAHLYQDVLHRPLDQAAIDSFFPGLDRGTLSPLAVALAVLRSLEYRNLLVQGFYASFLHRPATPAEVAAGVALLAGGGTDEDVEAGILGSAELFAAAGGTNAGFATALYQTLLGRPPSAAELSQLDAALGSGLSRSALALQLLRGTESRTRLIGGYFQAFLGRGPTDAERSFFLGRMAAGDTDEQIAADIIGSNEYFTKGGDYKATVDWGDGTSGPVAITRRGQQQKTCGFVGVHHYPTPGDRILKITVTSPNGTTTTLTGLVHVLDHPLPPPGKENVEPFGIVLIKVNGRFVRLRNFRVIGFPTELDTTRGRVRLTSHDGSKGTFYEGRFLLQQSLDKLSPRSTRRVAQALLTGGNLAVCKARTTSGVDQGQPRRRRIRHLWGNAKGSFRTKGKYASATVRGTLWETIDYCEGTLVRVIRGRVLVVDTVRNTRVIVGAGHNFFSPAP